MIHKKTILITGVLGGIGSAIAELFKERGWYVIGIDYKKSNGKKNFIDEFYNIDLSDPDEIERLSIKIQEEEIRLGCVVNNAAIQISKNILDTTVEEWNKTFDVNTRAAFLIAKFFHPALKKNKASIVNISSVHSTATSLNIAAYAASKGALSTLTRAMALEFANDGIRVNTILPGAIDTDMLKDGLKRNKITNENLAAKHPVGRIGVPNDIAELIYFLADNKKSAFITGQEFIVDGGVLARLSSE
ncbi:short-chain dehydrogenase [Candidatus Wolfebacteria bacterium]|nr:MAG: short-chain dehydrogenase [Candidatus Wolfebacteria bacterium]